MCTIAITANRGCKDRDSNGGFKAFYPFPFLEDAFTITDGLATAVNAELSTVYKYDLYGDNNSFSAPIVVDEVTHSSLCTQTTSLRLFKVDGDSSNQLTKMGQGRHMGVLEDKNGNLRIIGHETGFKTFTATETVEGVMNGFVGYDVEIVSEIKNLTPILDSATATAFKALVYDPS